MPRVWERDGAVTLLEVKQYLDVEMTRQARRDYSREQVASARGEAHTVLAVLSHPPTMVIADMDIELVAVKNANVRLRPSVSSEKLTTLPSARALM